MIPTAIHEMRATLRTTRHRGRQHEPKPVGDLTRPPVWMNRDQKKLWNSAIAHAPKGLLKKLDASVLATWVVACEIHSKTSAHLADAGMQGLLYKTPTNGTLIQSPLLGVLNRQAEIMLRAAAELGFTPASRARVTISSDENADEDPAEAYFRPRLVSSSA